MEIAILWSHTNGQTGAPAFGYPAKDQRELAAECRRLMSMLVADKHPYRKLVPAHMCCAARTPRASASSRRVCEIAGLPSTDRYQFERSRRGPVREPAWSQLDQGCKDRIEVAFAADVQDTELRPKRAGPAPVS